MPHTDVLILGAGVAGLAAAAELSGAGFSVHLLEARDRIGGRIHTLHDPAFPAPVELGAEFVHGLPPETWNIIRSANLTAYEGIDEHWILEKPGTKSATRRDPARKRLIRAEDFWERLESVLGRLERIGPRDTTFDAFATNYANSARLKRNLALARAYVEGFNAADAKRISAKSLVGSQQASEQIQGTRLFRLLTGYDSIVAALSASVDSQRVHVSLNTTVKLIRWRAQKSAAKMAGRSNVEDANIQATAFDPSGRPETFTADRAIVTLPLSILQAPLGDTAAVDFQPALPPRKTSAIARLAMGTVVKVILRFREGFWETMPLPALDPPAPLFDLSFLHGTDLSFPTWWTLRPLHTPMLIGWAGGPTAAELSRLSQGEILTQALNSLHALLGLAVERLRGQLSAHYIADWLSDPFSRGAYSYIPRGATDAVESLAAPEGRTMFFAGEATHHEGLSGTVAGAIGSGQRAAREVIAESPRAH